MDKLQLLLSVFIGASWGYSLFLIKKTNHNQKKMMMEHKIQEEKLRELSHVLHGYRSTLALIPALNEMMKAMIIPVPMPTANKPVEKKSRSQSEAHKAKVAEKMREHWAKKKEEANKAQEQVTLTPQ